MATKIKANDVSVQRKLFNLFEHLLPVVDDLADKLGVLLVVSTAMLTWILVFMLHLQGYSLFWSCLIVSLPLFSIIILLRFWFALEGLKDIPTVAEELIDDVSEDVAQSWHAVKSGKKGALNVFQQAKNLWQIKSMLSLADDILDQYFNIGIFLNPLSLVLGVSSLITLFFLFLAGGILAILSVF